MHKRFLIEEGDYENWIKRKNRNRMFFGFCIAAIGILLMLKTIGFLDFFTFMLTWPILLIVVGLLLGIKSGFRNNAWWILIIVGIANLTPEFKILGKSSTDFVWPAIIIIGGLAIALRPRNKNCYPKTKISSFISTEGEINIDVTFGGKKEVITSKDFKGGNVSVTFGGYELNLAQADFATPTVTLDCRVAFGGVELIVPSNWEIRNEIITSFGGVEDERQVKTVSLKEEIKILILTGSCSFGSIEIKSY